MTDRSAAAKLSILQQIYALAREQREALQRDQLERFQQILDQRDALITRLDMLQNGGVDVSELPDNVVAFPVSSAATVDDQLALDTVIRGILEFDSANELTLGEKMDEIRETLPELARGDRLASAYRIEETRGRVLDRPA